MNYQAVEETIKANYREVSAQYRLDDEIEVNTDNHRRLSARLKAICTSFPRPIAALEIGCGTGRFFHALTNVQQLVGLDISEDMLRGAENPVRQEEVSIPDIRLVRANGYLTSFPPESFHVIYSLGMFGNGCPVTVEICNKFYDWLKPGGKLFFNTVDVAGLPRWYQAWRIARQAFYPLASRRLKTLLDERQAKHPWFVLTRRQLGEILKQTRFTDFQIKSEVCKSPLWNGRHLECLATKT